MANPIQLYRGDDWPFSFAYQDTSLASITAVLTGATPNVAPPVSIAAPTLPGGIQAVATCAIVAGALVVTMENTGLGYDLTKPPAVVIAGAIATPFVGAPVDLTGFTPSANAYFTGQPLATPLALAASAFDPTAGAFSFLIPRAATANIPADAKNATSFPARLVVQMLDVAGDLTTIGITYINVLDARTA